MFEFSDVLSIQLLRETHAQINFSSLKAQGAFERLREKRQEFLKKTTRLPSRKRGLSKRKSLERNERRDLQKGKSLKLSLMGQFLERENGMEKKFMAQRIGLRISRSRISKDFLLFLFSIERIDTFVL